jgi:hypothetical protein
MQAAENLSSLCRADLADTSVLNRERIDPAAWNDASLRWLVGGVRVLVPVIETASQNVTTRPSTVTG